MDGMEHEETGTLKELGIEFNEIRCPNLKSEDFHPDRFQENKLSTPSDDGRLCAKHWPGNGGNPFDLFLASPDALEVIVVRHLLIVSTDLTDVTLVSDDTY